MKNKYSEYPVEKTYAVDRLVNARVLNLSSEDVEVGRTYDFWEFLYVDVGEVSLGLAGTDCTLKQGDICFFKPGTRYSLQGNSAVVACVFSVSFFCDSFHMRVFHGKKGTLPGELVKYMPELMQAAGRCFELSGQALHHEGLSQKKIEDVFGGMQSFVNRFELFLIELARREISPYAVPLVVKSLLKDELVVRVITILEENVYQKLNMAQIVQDLNYSETYIARRFKSVCGQSIMSYYLHLRIRESQRLIRDTEKNFTEIAGMLGFSDSQHFTKTFKRYVNLSPKEYLKLVRPYAMRRNKNLSSEDAQA